MKRTILATLIVLFAATLICGQNVMPSDYKADQVLKSNARVNPTSLAMELSIPIGGYKGRAGNGIPIAFNYSSKVWQMETFLGGPFEFMSGTKTALLPTYAKRTAAGWSSTVGSPRIDYPPNVYEVGHYNSQYDGQMFQPIMDCTSNCANYDLKYIKRLQVIMPDGSSHEFRQDDTLYSYGTAQTPGTMDLTGTYLSVDGSRMRLEVSSGGATLFLPDGGRYIWTTWPASSSGAAEFYDRHGNKMTFNTSTRVWTDTIGRTITDPFPDNWTDQSQSVGTMNSHFPGIGSDTLDVNYVWAYLKDPSTSASVIDDPDNTSQELSYSSSAYCTSGGGVGYHARSGADWLFSNPESTMIWVCSPQSTKFNPIVLKSIDLPNGQSYQFRYNAFGEITKVIYPTGGYERFKYAMVASVQPNGLDSYDQANRGVIDRWISEKGDGSDEIHWTYAASGGVVNAPDGTKTEQSVYTESPGSPQPYGFGDAKTGRPFEERSYNSSNQLMSRKLTIFETTGPLSGGYSAATRDMRPTKAITIIFEPGNSYALATMTETVYDTTGNSDPAYFSSLNPKQQKTYNYISIATSTATSASISTASGWFSSSDLAVVTEMDYLYDSNYKARNINGLVTETRVKDPSGNVKAKSQVSYDEVGTYPFLTDVSSSYWTDPSSNYRGLLTTTKSWTDITNNLSVQTHAQYDRLGNLRNSWDANGNLSQIEYSSTYDRAYPTKTISPIPDTSGTYGLNDELETTMTYDFDTAQPLTVTDPNGAVTAMEYDDPLFRQTKVTTGYGTALAAQTITEYGAGTSASTRWVKAKAQIDATSWKEAISWSDGLGRGNRSQSIDAEDGDVFTLACYDNMGRVSKTTNPFRGYSTQNCSTTNGTSGIYWTTNTFDAAGRPWKITTPDSAVVETNYSLASASGYLLGSVVTVTDQAGKVRRSVTNALGQLKRVDEPTTSGLGSLSSPNQGTTYAYDLLNNLTTVTQGDQTRTFSYDDLSRLKEAANPESGTTKYTYDGNGNLKTKWDARGIKTIYDYDSLNRVWKRCYKNVGTSSLGYTTCATASGETAESNTPDVTYYYDNITNGKGKLKKVTSSVSTTEYTSFDILGRVTGHKQTTDGTDYTTSYTYKLSGALDEETYPSGRVVKNVMDASGDLAMVESKKNAASGYWAYAKAFNYNAAGAATSLQLGNGRWESTTFNSRLQPTQIALGTLQSGTDKLKLDYTYGTTANNGNVLTQTITVPNVGANYGFTAVQTYSYDELNRLKDATENVTPNPSGTPSQSWKQEFSYDRYGNRNFVTGSGHTTTLGSCTTMCNPAFDASTNKITSSGYTYDASGNTTADPSGQSFVYDGENKQVSAANGSGTLGEYTYDGDGKRVKKVVPGTGETTIFLYDAAGKQIAEYSTVVANSTDAKVAYLTNDHLGSPRINSDANGTIRARHDYHPYGEEIAGTGGRSTALNYGNDTVRKQFTGYETDSETGLDFAQARYLASGLGRFSSVDPIKMTAKRLADPQRINLFTYCRNNPLKFTDPLGDDVVLQGGMTRKEVDQLLNAMADAYLTQGGYNFINNEEQSTSGNLILNNDSLSSSDSKDRITYGKTSAPSGSSDITITLDLKRRDDQDSTYTLNEIQLGSKGNKLEKPPTKEDVAKEEVAHAVDARQDRAGYLAATVADKSYSGADRNQKPSEVRRIKVQNDKANQLQVAVSKGVVKNREAAIEQLKKIVDYSKYQFAQK